jgi:hypothetical protein
VSRAEGFPWQWLCERSKVSIPGALAARDRRATTLFLVTFGRMELVGGVRSFTHHRLARRIAHHRRPHGAWPAWPVSPQLGGGSGREVNGSSTATLVAAGEGVLD